MKIQETVEARFGKKFDKISGQVSVVDALVIDLAENVGGTAKEFLSTYKKFIKAVDKLTALVGE